MSEATNPIFDNDRELLERQKEEYKRALMGDVDSIKTQGQELGKKVALAGGLFLAGYLLKRMVSSSGKKKGKKGKKKKQPRAYDSAGIPTMTEQEMAAREQENGYGFTANPMPDIDDHTSTKEPKGFMQSDIAKIISSQVATLLIAYLTKKVSDHLNTISENNDIAATPAPKEEVTVVETTEIIVPREDAI